jgi:hypothetical protein
VAGREEGTQSGELRRDGHKWVAVQVPSSRLIIESNARRRTKPQHARASAMASTGADSASLGGNQARMAGGVAQVPRRARPPLRRRPPGLDAAVAARPHLARRAQIFVTLRTGKKYPPTTVDVRWARACGVRCGHAPHA